MSSRFSSYLELLESRIAPAAVVHPLPDIDVGAGQTGTIVDLSKLFDFSETGNHANRTLITIETNFDIDPNQDGIQPGYITIELFDDVTPLTVQNFLRYAFNQNADGDYDGTFFHRLAQGFVLQGGGYQYDGKEVEHIDNFPEVHNEFDASRSNVRGTLALAKTGLGPNTGTSEWFINLADNGSNLDNQNGGFTVFGRVLDMPGVVDGMEVVDMIAQLPTVTGVVGSFPTPVQDYDAEDGLKPENLITIKNVTVTPSSGGSADASVVAKYKVDVSGAQGLVKNYRIEGTNLILEYEPGKAGIADIKITIPDGNGELEESFSVKVQPNLITSFAANALPGALLPGDGGKVKLNLTNTGGGFAEGDVEVRFYFAKAVLVGGQYQPVDPLVRMEANTATVPVKIGSGDTVTVTVPVHVPSELVVGNDTVYQLFAEIVPKNGTVQNELYSDDNATLQAGGTHQIVNAFGNVGDKNRTLTYTDADGDQIVLKLKGKGYGQLFLQPDGKMDIQINGTDAKTKIVAKKNNSAAPFEMSVRNIEASTTVGSVNFGLLDVSGNLVFANGVKNLKVGNVTGPSTMSIGYIPGSENTRTTLSFGRVQELSLGSTMPIASLKALEWLDRTGIQDSINAPSLQSLTIGSSKSAVRGDLEASVDLSSSATVQKFTVHGMLNDATVRIYGNVGKVTLGGIKDSDFIVGANVVPDSLEDFAEDRTVRNFTIKGLAGEQFSFVNSTVAAIRFLNLNVGNAIDSASEGDTFGVVADVINKYRSAEEASNKPLKTPGEFDEQGNYVVKIV